ncbi:MAG: N-acetylmuramoyl-L-alanine amidase [Myxococcota bacterium]
MVLAWSGTVACGSDDGAEQRHGKYPRADDDSIQLSRTPNWTVELPVGAVHPGLTIMLEADGPIGPSASIELRPGGERPWAALRLLHIAGRWAVYQSDEPIDVGAELRGSRLPCRAVRVALHAASSTESRASPPVQGRPGLPRPHFRKGVTGRREWGAASPRCTASRHEPREITLHHTASSVRDDDDAASHVRILQTFHQEGRGWCDIGYHFLIAPSGEVFEGRPLHRTGAHVAGHNLGNIGVALLGCFDSHGCTSPEWPTKEAVEAVRRLTEHIADVAGGGFEVPVAPHRAHAQTLCPGSRVIARWNTLQSSPRRAEWSLPRDPNGLDDETRGSVPPEEAPSIQSSSFEAPVGCASIGPLPLHTWAIGTLAALTALRRQASARRKGSAPRRRLSR